MLFCWQMFKGKTRDDLSSSLLIMGSSYSLSKTKATTETIENNMCFVFLSHASRFQQYFKLLSHIS